MTISAGTWNLLREQLRKEILSVTFTKADGTERTMKCTLREDVLPKVEFDKSQSDKEPNFEVVPVWDIDKSAWRSFRIDSIKSVESV